MFWICAQPQVASFLYKRSVKTLPRDGEILLLKCKIMFILSEKSGTCACMIVGVQTSCEISLHSG